MVMTATVRVGVANIISNAGRLPGSTSAAGPNLIIVSPSMSGKHATAMEEAVAPKPNSGSISSGTSPAQL
jgi:hypothetical protein